MNSEKYERFIVTITSDAFPIGSDYAIYDNVMGDYYKLSDGTIPTFETETEAIEHCHMLRLYSQNRSKAALQLAEWESSYEDEIFEQYQTTVKKSLLEDIPYLNACKNSDKENAMIEGDFAIKRALNDVIVRAAMDVESSEMEFYKLYFDNSDFAKRFNETLLEDTYYSLANCDKNETEVLASVPLHRRGR